MAPGPDVHEVPLVQLDGQGEVVEGGRERAVAAEHAGSVERDVEPERREQRGEQPVELVTEPTTPTPDDLVDERLLGQHDALTEVDGEVLEGHGLEVSPVQLPQGRHVRRVGPPSPDPVEIAADGVRIHETTVPAPPRWRSRQEYFLRWSIFAASLDESLTLAANGFCKQGGYVPT